MSGSTVDSTTVIYQASNGDEWAASACTSFDSGAVSSSYSATVANTTMTAFVGSGSAPTVTNISVSCAPVFDY